MNTNLCLLLEIKLQQFSIKLSYAQSSCAQLKHKSLAQPLVSQSYLHAYEGEIPHIWHFYVLLEIVYKAFCNMRKIFRIRLDNNLGVEEQLFNRLEAACDAVL